MIIRTAPFLSRDRQGAVAQSLTTLSLILACLAALLGGAARAQEEGIDWLGDYREALRQARQTGKPILLEFRCEA
jgi:hypothetical protein